MSRILPDWFQRGILARESPNAAAIAFTLSGATDGDRQLVALIGKLPLNETTAFLLGFHQTLEQAPSRRCDCKPELLP